MKARVRRWGNSLGIRLPKALTDEIGIKTDSPVEIRAEAGSITITPAIGPRAKLRSLLARVTPENMHPVMFDDAPVGREEW